MASNVIVRHLSDGTPRYRVEWRDKSQGGKLIPRHFSDENTAKRFKKFIEGVGHVLPDAATLIRAGFPMLVDERLTGTSGSAITIVDYAGKYIARRVKLGAQQRKTYEQYVRDYLLPFFGVAAGIPARMSVLRRAHMRAWQEWMIDERKLSPKTVCNVRGLLVPMFAQACQRGEMGEPAIIEFSPMDGLDAPEVVTPRRHVLRTAEHATLFFDTAYDLNADFADLLYVVTATAARWGEGLAFKPDAVHLGGKRPVVEILRTAVRVTGQGWIIRPWGGKSKAAMRTLPITESVAGILAARCAKYSDLLFPAPDGGLWPQYGNVWRDQWRPIVEATRRRGLPYDMTIHGLRKSMLSKLANDGGASPVALKNFGGHESFMTTFGIYSEHTGAGADTFVDTIDAFLPAR